MSDFEDELRSTFIEEARELVEAAEAGIMALDAGDSSDELLNRIFRVAHSFKGSAAAVGFHKLSKFAHKMEDVLAKLKSREIPPDHETCSVFFACIDILRAYTNGLATNVDFNIDSSIVENRLLNCLGKSAQTNLGAKNELDQGFGMFDDSPQSKPIHSVNPQPENRSEKQPANTSGVVKESDSIRVATPKLDALLNAVGELVINQSMIEEHKNLGTLNSVEAIHAIEYLKNIVNEVKEVSLSLRMLPVKSLCMKMQRAVRDASVALSKDINFVITGEHIELDKILLETMTDPLTHLVRNAVDHGIEIKEERVMTSKSAQARIDLSIVHDSDKVFINILDDGKGLNRDSLIKKAVEKGLINPSQTLTDEEAFKLIFLPGFSTKESVTEISGRGVGLDVVKKGVEKLQGSLSVSSTPGLGSKFTIALPVSFSIIQGMVIVIDKKKYVIPVPQVIETLQFHKFKIESSMGEGRMMNFRGEVIPVYSLGQILHGSLERNDTSEVLEDAGLVATTNGKKVSYEIDGIVGLQQIVLKKLGRELQGIRGFKSGAILANGEPSIVLNLEELEMKGHRHAA